MPSLVENPKRREIPRGMSRRKIHDMQAMAAEQGLLQGKTEVVRGRMPGTLVSAAKKNTGIRSQTELLKLGLAMLALEDNYADWLISRRGRLPADLDLEF
ncbi:MAG: hypothetical protein ABSA94_16535 [Acidobacteriaceae bacterium]|jgi:hypothetical protein